MELFTDAKEVRLRSHHDKYLTAEEDEESVCQQRNGTSRRSRWTVEFPEGGRTIRLKSCYGRYLTASNEPFLLGMTGRKVTQTLRARRLDSSVEWEPVRDGFQVRLRTHYAQFLRANGGLPPWRNTVTHDIPHRTATQDWVLWDVDVVQIAVPAAVASPPPPSSSGALDSRSSSPPSTASTGTSPRGSSRFQSSSSLSSSPPKPDGRTIHYYIADDAGIVDESFEGPPFQFKGTNVQELTSRLEEEVGLSDMVVCSRNPMNGKLYPLRLQLPPNNTPMHVVIVSASSKVARGFM